MPKFDQYDETTTPDPTDILLVKSGGETRKVQIGNLNTGAISWYGPYVVWANMLQKIDLTGDPPDNGTFTLSYDGVESSAIQWDASATDIEAILDAIPALTGKVNCYKETANPVSDPGELPGDLISVVIRGTPARPKPLIVEDNSLTASAVPVTDPVVDFAVNDGAYVRLRKFNLGEILDNIYVRTVEEFASGTEKTLFVSSDGPASPWHPPEADYIELFGAQDPQSGEDHFSSRSGPPNDAVGVDAGGGYADMPSVALIDNAALFMNVKFRTDDSSGIAHVYLRVGMPITP